MALKGIINRSTTLSIVHYTSSKSPERRYVQRKLPHDTVSSSTTLFDFMHPYKCDIFFVLKQGFVVLDPLLDGFLERWCRVALSHKRHNKLLRQFSDEQTPRVCHFPRVIWLQCFE